MVLPTSALNVDPAPNGSLTLSEFNILVFSKFGTALLKTY
jgi:hypothetical protein